MDRLHCCCGVRPQVFDEDVVLPSVFLLKVTFFVSFSRVTLDFRGT